MHFTSRLNPEGQELIYRDADSLYLEFCGGQLPALNFSMSRTEFLYQDFSVLYDWNPSLLPQGSRVTWVCFDSAAQLMAECPSKIYYFDPSYSGPAINGFLPMCSPLVEGGDPQEMFLYPPRGVDLSDYSKTYGDIVQDYPLSMNVRVSRGRRVSVEECFFGTQMSIDDIVAQRPGWEDYRKTMKALIQVLPSESYPLNYVLKRTLGSEDKYYLGFRLNGEISG